MREISTGVVVILRRSVDLTTSGLIDYPDR
jgi:hypothetical protein